MFIKSISLKNHFMIFIIKNIIKDLKNMFKNFTYCSLDAIFIIYNLLHKPILYTYVKKRKIKK